MPDREGKLSPEEIETVKAWLQSRQAFRPCPACAFNEWTVGDRLAFAPTFAAGIQAVVMASGAGYPFVVVWCNRCTNFRFHSAIAIGLVVTGPPQQSTSSAQEEVKHGA